MNYLIVEQCLEDYLEVLRRCGSEENQDDCEEAINEFQRIKEKCNEII